MVAGVSRSTYTFGASVQGPLHRSERRPNEDAWMRDSGAFGTLVVACDGMGSKPHARTGARAACQAVKEAVRRWAQVDGAPVSDLTDLIEVYWRLRIHPLEPSSAATTCLFALRSPDQTWLAGGIGDGLVIVRTGTELQTIVGRRDGGFSNETTGLGITRGRDAWELVQFAPTSEDRMALLATDGVSDDLRPETLGGLCDWLSRTFEGLESRQRWRRLTTELTNWPTPHHLDDKTLAVMRTSAVGVQRT